MILDRPNHFGLVQILLNGSKLYFSGLIWTRPKLFEQDQNDFDPSKIIWPIRNYFEPIKGKGMKEHVRAPHIRIFQQLVH